MRGRLTSIMRVSRHTGSRKVRLSVFVSPGLIAPCGEMTITCSAPVPAAAWSTKVRLEVVKPLSVIGDLPVLVTSTFITTVLVWGSKLASLVITLASCGGCSRSGGVKRKTCCGILIGNDTDWYTQP